jgi:carboxylesterase
VEVSEVLLEQSYHVATLDHDAERIFEESHAFIGRLAPSPGRMESAMPEARGGSTTGG